MFARISDWNKGTWLAILVLSFWVAWPVGLAFFIYLAASGRLQAWVDETVGPEGIGAGLWSGVQAMFSAGPRAANRSSGNDAFDAYRKAELERLEEEGREFKAFLERLRRARDKAEFDQFMAERRRVRPPLPAGQEPQS